MGSGKLSNSETSSEEIDQPEKPVNDDNTGIGRSYECTFCKRGFTNAQALGGHMNIHRKDKAKAKQKNHHHQQQQQQDQSSVMMKSHEDYNYSCSKYFAPSSHEQRQYGTAMSAYMSYQLYFPSSNPSYFNADNQYDLSSPRSGHQHLSMHEFRMDQALSLSVGPSHTADVDERNIVRNDGEVDLELRLGHYP